MPAMTRLRRQKLGKRLTRKRRLMPEDMDDDSLVAVEESMLGAAEPEPNK
jgi:hypothetical protein